MLSEIRLALKTGKVAELYERISGKKIDYNCGQCIADAKIYLQVKEQELLRELAPIHVYLLNPSQESLLQNQDNPHISKLIVAESTKQAIDSFESDAVNVIAHDVFFIDITKVKQIKPYQAYALCLCKWNGNGTAKKESDIAAWVFRGKARRELNLSGYVVSNPEIHALRLVE